MHPDDQAFVDRLPAQVAKLREQFPRKPARAWEDEEGIYDDPRRRDYPASSPNSGENLTTQSAGPKKDPGNGWTSISRGPRLTSDPKTGSVSLAEETT